MRVRAEVPQWPAPWALLGLLLGSLVGVTATLLLGRVVTAILPQIGPALFALLSSAALAASFCALIVWFAGRTEPVGARQFGILGLSPGALGGWLVVCLAPALALGALGLATQDGAAQVLLAPPELTGLAASPDPAGPVAAPFGVELVISALARAVIPAAASAFVIYGFALPAMAQRFGAAAGIVLAAILSAAPFGALLAENAPALAPAAALLGGLASVAYLAGGSILPGAAALGLGLGLCFAGSIEASIAAAVVLGLGAAALAAALILAVGAAWSGRSTPASGNPYG